MARKAAKNAATVDNWLETRLSTASLSSALRWACSKFAYANLQVLGEAIEGAKSLDQTKLADYIRSHPFNTIVGEISFGNDGKWAKPARQFQDIQGTDLKQFRDTRTEAILEPTEFRTGKVVEPYSSVKK